MNINFKQKLCIWFPTKLIFSSYAHEFISNYSFSFINSTMMLSTHCCGMSWLSNWRKLFLHDILTLKCFISIVFGDIIFWIGIHQQLIHWVKTFINACLMPCAVQSQALNTKCFSDVIMSTITSHITDVSIVYSSVSFRRRSKKTSKFRVTGLCEGNSPMTGEFPAQRSSNAGNVSNSWRHHAEW